MKRMVSKKSHSWWWDSHISPKNSKWLAENLEEMDRRVKEMLNMIEEEGDSLAKKAEMYYQRRPQLISHVEDFYRMYRALAERYDNVTGELRKTIPSELHPAGSGSGSDFGSEPPSPSLTPSPEQTPERRQARPKPGKRAAGFEFFLGSGGSSDRSRKGSEGSSSSESDSDSDDSKDMNGDDNYSGVNTRMVELENELNIVKEKLRKNELNTVKQNDLSLMVSALENDLLAANEKLDASEAEIFALQQKLMEKSSTSEAVNADHSMENKLVSELESRVVMLEAEISEHKLEIEHLKGVISAHELTIKEYKVNAANASDRFCQEKSRLEAVVLNLEGVIEQLKAEAQKISQEKSLLEASVSEQECMIQELKNAVADSTDRFSQEKSSLEAEISSLSQSNASLKATLVLLEAEKEQACTDKDKRIAELNRNLDGLKLRADMLTAEKDDLRAQVSHLNDEIRSRDDRVRRMDEHLHQLHLEHAKLITEIDGAQKLGWELRERVKELEEEVERQRIAITDGAEGKREAIRQLCFSLEHYRDGYHQLRQVLQVHCKRPAVLAV